MFFTSQEKCPTVIQNCFNNPFFELWLWFAHLASLFQKSVLQIESAKCSMVEVFIILSKLKKQLIERKNMSFLPIKIKNLLKILEKDNVVEVSIIQFKKSVTIFYCICI